MTNLGILASYLVLWALVLCLTATVYVLARHVGMLHIRTGNPGARVTNMGPEMGAKVPELTAETLDGNQITLGGVKRYHTLLVFIAPGCFNCSEMAPFFRTVGRHEHDVRLVLVGRGDEPSNRDYLERNHLSGLTAVCSAEIHSAYGITGIPYAVLLDATGAVTTKGIVNTAVHLESILNAALVGYPTAESRVTARQHASSAVGNQ